MNSKKLMDEAIKAMENSYSPYSRFKVGAALLCRNGRIYSGCNIENAAFPAGICAERTAFFKAVSEGNTDFKAIAVVGGNSGNIKSFCYPCGICRQVFSEFCGSDFKIILFDGESIKELSLKELLPFGFGSENLC